MRSPLRVIVVDDNHLIRRLLDLVLSTAGYLPVDAESAEDALALAAVDPPDAWVIDHEMPGLPGAELVRRLRASPDPRLARAAIVGLSGHAASEPLLRAAGATEFVPKPVQEPVLLEALARAIRVAGRGDGPPPTRPAA